MLKGFLVLAGIDFGKTHDLNSLGASVVEKYQELAPLVAPIRACTNWGMAYRYPDMQQTDSEPSAEDLSRALDHIARLADALEAHTQPPAPPSSDPH